MDVLDDENDKLILSQIADALENNYLEINPLKTSMRIYFSGCTFNF